ncbi:MAG: RNA 2'-phosphotransferase [Deltaproteobacteria bacterium]|nr:RNA 2'-phosphotransferase [Deltaproteobacteria bacterium]
MSKKNRIRTKGLGQLMQYILGHKPYEFGLIPDSEGFVAFKELLQAIHEEDGWGYVRQGNIHEVLSGRDRERFQADETRIRAMDRHWELDIPAQVLPKILFFGIRRRAHPVVMEKGIREINGHYHILTPERDMAERIGRRRDQQPVLLEIMAHRAHREGVMFYSFGDLFLTNEIQVRYIAGPPVPKEIVRTRGKKPKKDEEEPPDFQAGTFLLDQDRDLDRSRRSKGGKRKGWKEEARRDRKKHRA